MKPKRQNAHSETRIPQVVPESIRDEALHYIRAKFYAELPEKRFYQDRALLLRFVIFWPATWLRDKGVTLPMDRYREILLGAKDGILPTAARMGDIPRNPVAYLGKAVENRFHHQGERYYEEAKGVTGRVDNVLQALKGIVGQAPKIDPVAQMAEAARALAASPKRRAKKPAAPSPKAAEIPSQEPELTLF